MRKTIIILMCLSVLHMGAKVRLSGIVADNMVLQQQTDANIWGWSDKKVVTVTPSWDKAQYKANVGEDGFWQVKVRTPKASFTPQSIVINDGEKKETLTNVLIGEVWICSGQSNMEMGLNGFASQPVNNAFSTVMQSGRYADKVRFNMIKKVSSDTFAIKRRDMKWQIPSPETTGKCSAVAWHFACSLSDALNVPVGIVISAWGGTKIEEWMDGGKRYKSMLAPATPMTATGFVWYQGESNVPNGHEYAGLQKEMVGQWRKVWGNDKMPFYAVMIAPYKYAGSEQTAAAVVRDQQIKSMSMIDNYALTCTMDIGDEHCIHPSSKEQVGMRLAAQVLHKTYGMVSVPCDGPMFEKVEFADGKAQVSFANAERGLYPADKQLNGFEIAGEDKVFFKAHAKAKFKGNTVTVWADSVKTPKYVRYAYKNYPGALSLQSTWGIPALPFTTE